MLNSPEVSLNQIIVHAIGNRPEEEGVRLSRGEMNIHDHTVEDILKQYFLSHFKTDYFYRFSHESDLQLNEVYNYACQLFADPAQFYEQSVNLANHLYQKSNHPKIKTGELYVVRFSDIQIGDEIVDAIGLFKSENKDTYLKVYQNNDNYQVGYEDGINIKKLDKGCLIFNTEEDMGFKVSIIDSTNKSNEAAYWRDEFLAVMPCENEYYQTNQVLDMCKGFSENVLTEEHNIDKHDQVAFVKRAEEYFSKNELFENDNFKQSVIGDEEISQAFEEYKQEFEHHRNLSPVDQFEISSQALKKGKKFFRSVIKLDKNFHVYVHSNPDFIEKGYDNGKGLNYYKLFFHEEQ